VYVYVCVCMGGGGGGGGGEGGDTANIAKGVGPLYYASLTMP